MGGERSAWVVESARKRDRSTSTVSDPKRLVLRDPNRLALRDPNRAAEPARLGWRSTSDRHFLLAVRGATPGRVCLLAT